jgi:hypothetical protein
MLTRLSLEIAAGQTRKRRENYSGVPDDREIVELFKLSYPDPWGPIRRGGCPLTGNGSFRFDLIYLQQPLDVAGHDQAKVLDL